MQTIDFLLFGGIIAIVGYFTLRFMKTWGWVKNLVFFLGAATIFASCDEFAAPEYSLAKPREKTINDCEYLVTSTGTLGGEILTHKGNCKNPIHIYNTKQ